VNREQRAARASRTRIEVPLVRTGEPGTVKLTNDRIAQILEEEDVGRYRERFGQLTAAIPDSRDKPPSP
jgi:hypothetical protein